jgi:hypothetical protein
MLSQLAVEIEPDDDGFHGIVTDATLAVVHVTNTYPGLEEAARAAWNWIFTTPNGRTPMSDNESVPRFIAYVSDSYVEADDNLEALIAIVVRDGRGTAEDCVVWDGFHNVAAVILADGTVHRFRGRPQPKPAPQDVDARLKNVFVKRRRPS